MIAKKIVSQRGTVHYWKNECKSDLSIVFCHGLTADHHLFDKQLDELNNHYSMITWDYPLHGKSRPYSDFTYDNVSEELYSILQKENIENIVLVGQSAGGYIAQHFISKYPEMVKGFISIGSTPFGKKYYKKSELFWIKHFTTIAKLYPFSYYCKVSAKSITMTEEARDSFYKGLIKLGREGMLTAAKAVYDEFLLIEDEVDFQCPVLLTIGEFDKTGYIQRYNSEWADKTGYPLEVIENASHNANFDNYKMFNKLLLEFLQKISISN